MLFLRRVSCKAVFLFTLTQCLSPVSGQTVPVNVSDYPVQYSGSQLAYYRWRSWLLNHPSVLQKVPPVPKPFPFSVSEHLDVQVAVVLASVLSVDAARQTITFSASLKFEWVDKALAVDSGLINTFTDHGNASLMPYSVTVPTASLWIPPIILAEGVSALKVLLDAEEAEVTAEGTVLVQLSYVFTTSCRFNMADYPFDEHDCPITLVSEASMINVITTGHQWDRSLSSQFSVVGEWDLVGFMSTNLTVTQLSYQFSRFFMSIKRKTLFYTVVIIMPMVLTSYLNVLVFLLPPDVGDKTSYLVTISISLFVFTSFFAQDMPRGLDSVPHVFRLIIFVFVGSFVSLVLSLIVLRKYKTEQALQEAEVGTTSVNKKDGRVSPLCEQVKSTDTEKHGKGRLKVGSIAALSAKQLDVLFFVIVLVANTVGIVAIIVPMV